VARGRNPRDQGTFMAQDSPQDSLSKMTVRTYKPGDQKDVSRLYTEGLLSGQIAPNDTGADIENIQEGYLGEPSSHFWIAEVNGRVMGMIGVARDEGHVAEIRRLRVDPAMQTTAIAFKLVETALSHCKHHGFLKVVLDTRAERGAVQELFEKFGFHHTRTKNLHGKELLEFYLDLYRAPKKEGGA